MTNEELNNWLGALTKSFNNNPARKKLYEEVESAGSLGAKRSDGELWGSTTTDGNTVIEVVVPSKYPEAALAHELLHARIKNRGYKQYCVVVGMIEKRHYLKPLLPMLDNELQHNKFFPDFLRLGFAPDHMYGDSDADWPPDLQKSISVLSPAPPLQSFLFVYMTLIAPGGFGTAEDKKRLEDELQKRCAPGCWKRLRAIKAAIADYRDSVSLDAQTVIARILQELGGYEAVWIGYSKNFPASGFFIGEPFTMDAAQAYERDHARES